MVRRGMDVQLPAPSITVVWGQQSIQHLSEETLGGKVPNHASLMSRFLILLDFMSYYSTLQYICSQFAKDSDGHHQDRNSNVPH